MVFDQQDKVAVGQSMSGRCSSDAGTDHDSIDDVVEVLEKMGV
jgi:hypothetical protein